MKLSWQMGKLFGAGGEGGPGSYAREMSGKTVRGKISGRISKGGNIWKIVYGKCPKELMWG